ncbi:MAG: NfeD family protein [Bacteroidales bacterium]|nr:NfeD family protein [Bacteroidales bacterium]HKL67347.1 NfeD family protein [Bacteroidales bacterium]
MESLGIVIFLIILGILLFLVEFLVVPGITIAGIGGAISIITGIALSFYYQGPTTGLIVLICTAVLIGITVVFMLKAGTWRRLMLNKAVEGKVDFVRMDEGRLKIGDKGKAITRLNPMGKVMISDEYYEAKAQDKLIDQNTEVEIVKIESNRLIVKPLNT